MTPEHLDETEIETIEENRIKVFEWFVTNTDSIYKKIDRLVQDKAIEIANMQVDFIKAGNNEAFYSASLYQKAFGRMLARSWFD